MKNNLIRFDWAMKRLLRDKSNYMVLEGFLSTLLKEDLHIVRFLESESNQTDADDKFNRADMLVENSKGKLFIFVLQNYRELHYYHKMLFGASNLISEYANSDINGKKVYKICVINIVYFSMHKSEDYVYHGELVFRGLHNLNDILRLSDRQQELFIGKDSKVFLPEYYVLRVKDFDNVARTPLDEWIKYLNTGEIDDEATAKGLPEARERLRIDALSDVEKQACYRYMEALRYQRSVIKTGWDDGYVEGFKEGYEEVIRKGLAEGEAKGRAEAQAESAKEMERKMKDMAKKMKDAGMSTETIAHFTQLAPEEIAEL